MSLGQPGAEPTARPLAGRLLDGRQHVLDDLLLFFQGEALEAFAVGGAVTHELPAAPNHLRDVLGERLAILRVQRDRRLDARRVKHVGDSPEADAHAVFAPGIVDDVGHAVRGIGRHAAADWRIVVPNLHVGRDPDREGLIVRPGERLALMDDRVLVSIGPPHRAQGLCPGWARPDASRLAAPPRTRLFLMNSLRSWRCMEKPPCCFVSCLWFSSKLR